MSDNREAPWNDERRLDDDRPYTQSDRDVWRLLDVLQKNPSASIEHELRHELRKEHASGEARAHGFAAIALRHPNNQVDVYNLDQHLQDPRVKPGLFVKTYAQARKISQQDGQTTLLEEQVANAFSLHIAQGHWGSYFASHAIKRMQRIQKRLGIPVDEVCIKRWTDTNAAVQQQRVTDCTKQFANVAAKVCAHLSEKPEQTYQPCNTYVQNASLTRAVAHIALTLTDFMGMALTHVTPAGYAHADRVRNSKRIDF
jgi:hypothetical protein